MPELSTARHGMSIDGLSAWLSTPQGSHIARWLMAAAEPAVSDVFGYHAIQIGLPGLPLLAANRIPLRQIAGPGGPVDVRCQPDALPFASHSLDLVVLPLVLEGAGDPHEVLREVERTLIPEGQLVIFGFNPYSLWGLRRILDRSGRLPWSGRFFPAPRLKDWLKLLGFEVADSRPGCFTPPFQSAAWLRRWELSEAFGQRCCPLGGAVYQLRAIKRTHGLRLITPRWQRPAARAKALTPIAHRHRHDL